MVEQRRSAPLNAGKPTDNIGLVVEAWIEGFMLSALIVMCCITIANMRRGVLLHKLIFTELLLGLSSGFAIFNRPEAYGWYISATGTCMYISYTVHNVVAWMKNKPFLSQKASLLYISTVILVQPYWILESYANFAFFSGSNQLFTRTRLLETIFKDPWWVWTTISLFWNVKMRYGFSFLELLRISPRFCILLVAMCLSLCFVALDILAVTKVLGTAFLTGINPFWKLSFIFKCLTDSVILDDFKTALDKLRAVKFGRLRSSTAPYLPRDRPELPQNVHLLPQKPSFPEPSSEHLEHAETMELHEFLRMDKRDTQTRRIVARSSQSGRGPSTRSYEVV